METALDIKKEIIDAAAARFGLYGFNKTTMAEIAQDCNMSAGNIYRYFENKSDIGAECAGIHFKSCEETLRNIIRKPGLTVTERLKMYVLANLRITYELCTKQPKISELVEHMSKERQDIIEKFREIKTSLIAELLAEGNRTGEFDLPDVLKAAENIMIATFAFHAPPSVLLFHASKKPLVEMEDIAERVVQLLITGLMVR